MRRQVEVSVIISTRNRAAYLPDCIRSLAGQDTKAEFEVVLIDNGSSDGTAQIMSEWCEKDSRFRWDREERVGLSFGKNAGIRLARGTLLLFTDDDTIPASHWIEAYREFFARHAESLIVAGGAVVPVPSDLGGWPTWFHPDALADLALLDHGSERPLEKAEYVWGGNMAVPAAAFARLGTWDETVGRRAEERGTFEDVEFQDRLRGSGGSVWFHAGADVRHRVDPSNITPRRVASSAFGRGRNEFWIENVPRFGKEESVPRSPMLPAILGLIWHLWRWAVWATIYRVSSAPASFEHARRAAWSSGRALEGIRAGRGTTRSYRLLGRLTLRGRAIALLLLPDETR